MSKATEMDASDMVSVNVIVPLVQYREVAILISTDPSRRSWRSEQSCHLLVDSPPKCDCGHLPDQVKSWV